MIRYNLSPQEQGYHAWLDGFDRHDCLVHLVGRDRVLWLEGWELARSQRACVERVGLSRVVGFDDATTEWLN